MYPVKIKWTAGRNRDNLLGILANQWPTARLANQQEDFNGQFLYVGAEAIVFQEEQDRFLFLISYGADYDAAITHDPIKFEIVGF